MSAWVVAAAMLLVVAPAAPSPGGIVDDGMPGLLVLETAPSPFDVRLDPGERAHLRVTATLDAPDAATLGVEIWGSGPLAAHPGGLRLRLRECSVPWGAAGDTASCPGTATVVVADGPLSAMSSDVRDLGTLTPGARRHLLAEVSLPDPAPAELMGARGEFVLRFTAVGDVEVSGSGPPGPHPVTGVAVAVPIGLALALGLTGAGLRVVARRGRLGGVA